MGYEFKTLSQDEMDDRLVDTMRANEMDLNIHKLNKERYENMLADTDTPNGEWRQKIQTLLNDTNSRILEVESIIKHLSPQLPDKSRIDKSVARIKAK